MQSAKREIPLLVLFLAALGVVGFISRRFVKDSFYAPPPPPPWASLPAPVVETPDYLLYVPASLDAGKKHPLAVVLTPDGAIYREIVFWAPLAEKHQWIIYISRKYKANIDISSILSALADDVKSLIWTKPVDPAKIVASGLSAGGMGSHMLAHDYPSFFSAVIANTGMIHENFRNQPAGYPHGKLAVFIASPKDFRYQEMKEDRQFLESLDWHTDWVEFPNGHAHAPQSVYEEAIQWLEGNWKP